MPILSVPLLMAVLAATPARPTLPPTADQAMGVIVGVLREAESCERLRELQDALQPLLYVLGDLQGADADRILAKLQWYRLGGANQDVYDCIVTQRAIRSTRFRGTLADASNDCIVQLGTASSLCVSRSERSARVQRLQTTIRHREPCASR
ncbi:MAG: hypothetical protein AABO58_00880 [Acidobacteriota bacterium]